MKFAIISLTLATAFFSALADAPPYKNPNLPANDRVADLLGRMTLHIKRNDLAIWGAKQEWSVEPGEFTIWVGGNSEATLSKKFNLQ